MAAFTADPKQLPGLLDQSRVLQLAPYLQASEPVEFIARNQS
jgi:hypothetical protein